METVEDNITTHRVAGLGHKDQVLFQHLKANFNSAHKMKEF